MGRGAAALVCCALLSSFSAAALAANSSVAGRQLYVDGEPYFIVGAYLGTANSTDLEYLSTSGFNTALCYGYEHSDNATITAYLDDAASHNIKVLMNLKDLLYTNKSADMQQWRTIVELAQSHPALLGWYIVDEIDEHHTDLARAARKAIEAMDPHHVTFSVFYQNPVYYKNMTEVSGRDPYPWKNASTTSISDITKEVDVLMQVLGDRPTMCVSQIHDLGNYWPTDGYTEPPLAVKRTAAMLELLLGCRGLLLYSYFDNFRQVNGTTVVPATPATVARRLAEMANVSATVRAAIPYLWGEDVSAKVRVVDNPATAIWRAFVTRDAVGGGAAASAPRLFLANQQGSSANVDYIYNGTYRSATLPPFGYLTVDLAA